MPLIDRTTLTSLKGHPVTSSHGAKIGKIVDIYEAGSGVGTFVTVNTGLFDGHASFVPLDKATLVGGTIVVPYAQDLVKDAPRVGAGDELTVDEENRLYQHYAVPAPVPAAGPVAPTVPVTEDSMTRSEERMTVGTQTRESGRARLRKYVVTEKVSMTVPVTHDEVTITREPITAFDPEQAVAGKELSAEVHEVVLTEERAVATTRTVPVERVQMSTDQVTEQVVVTEDLGHEVIEVDKSS